MTFPATLIIPVLQQKDAWLEQAVTSAVDQSVACEVLVVTSPHTGPSNLRTLSRLQQTAPNLNILQQTRKGFAAAINQGIENASASRVGWLLSDDWLEPDAIEQSLLSSVDVVSTGLTTYAADGVTRVIEASPVLTQEEYEGKTDLEEKADYLGHMFLIGRKLLLEAGGLDESLGDSPGVDDYDLIWVLLEQGASVSIVEKRLYNYRDHEGERLTLRKRSDMIRTLEKILRKHKIKGEHLQQLLDRKSKWCGRPIHQVLEGVPSASEAQQN